MSKKILVIGENCLDFFVYCDCDRLSPEIEVPVLVPKYESQNLGMAGNVYENIQSLAPDWQVEFLRQLEKIQKVRYCSAVSGHNFIRIDLNDKVVTLTKEKFLFELKQQGFELSNFDAIVISSYNKGFLNEELIGWIANQHPFVFVDCKFVLGEWSKNVFCVKINKKEWNYNISQLSPVCPESFCKNLIVTLGQDGILWKNTETTYGQNKVEVANVSGAGDTVLAALVVSYLKNNNLEQAIKDANKAAAIAVSKRGVYAVKQEEVFG